MPKEEEGYEGLDIKNIQQRSSDCSMFIVKNIGNKELDYLLFKEVQKIFTVDELTYLASMFIAQKTKTFIQEDPALTKLISLYHSMNDPNV